MRILLALAWLLLAVPPALAQATDSLAAQVRARAYAQLERAGVEIARESLHDRCLADDSLSVRSLVTVGLPIDLVRTEATPLQAAAAMGAVRCATSLLNLGAQVDFDPASVGSPLALASGRGHVEIVRLLLTRGASLDFSKTLLVSEPMTRAAGRGHLDVMRLLFEAGATTVFGLNAAVSADQRAAAQWLVQRMLARDMEMAYWTACTHAQPRTAYRRMMERAGFTKTCDQLRAEDREAAGNRP